MCSPMTAHWRYLENAMALVLPFAYLSPQPKRQINQFSHFCTAHSRVFSGMPRHILSSNNWPFVLGSGPHIIHASLGSHESITQIHLDGFSRFSTDRGRVLLYFTMDCPFAPLKLPIPMGDLDPIEHDSKRAHWRNLVNTIELVLPLAHPSPQHKRHLDGSAVFVQMLVGVPILYNGTPFPLQNFPFPWGI